MLRRRYAHRPKPFLKPEAYCIAYKSGEYRGPTRLPRYATDQTTTLSFMEDLQSTSDEDYDSPIESKKKEMNKSSTHFISPIDRPSNDHKVLPLILTEDGHVQDPSGISQGLICRTYATKLFQLNQDTTRHNPTVVENEQVVSNPNQMTSNLTKESNQLILTDKSSLYLLVNGCMMDHKGEILPGVYLLNDGTVSYPDGTIQCRKIIGVNGCLIDATNQHNQTIQSQNQPMEEHLLLETKDAIPHDHKIIPSTSRRIKPARLAFYPESTKKKISQQEVSWKTNTQQNDQAISHSTLSNGHTTLLEDLSQHIHGVTQTIMDKNKDHTPIQQLNSTPRPAYKSVPVTPTSEEIRETDQQIDPSEVERLCRRINKVTETIMEHNTALLQMEKEQQKTFLNNKQHNQTKQGSDIPLKHSSDALELKLTQENVLKNKNLTILDILSMAIAHIGSILLQDDSVSFEEQKEQLAFVLRPLIYWHPVIENLYHACCKPFAKITNDTPIQSIHQKRHKKTQIIPYPSPTPLQKDQSVQQLADRAYDTTVSYHVMPCMRDQYQSIHNKKLKPKKYQETLLQQDPHCDYHESMTLTSHHKSSLRKKSNKQPYRQRMMFGKDYPDRYTLSQERSANQASTLNKTTDLQCPCCYNESPICAHHDTEGFGLSYTAPPRRRLYGVSDAIKAWETDCFNNIHYNPQRSLIYLDEQYRDVASIPRPPSLHVITSQTDSLHQQTTTTTKNGKTSTGLNYSLLMGKDTSKGNAIQSLPAETLAKTSSTSHSISSNLLNDQEIQPQDQLWPLDDIIYTPGLPLNLKVVSFERFEIPIDIQSIYFCSMEMRTSNGKIKTLRLGTVEFKPQIEQASKQLLYAKIQQAVWVKFRLQGTFQLSLIRQSEGIETCIGQTHAISLNDRTTLCPKLWPLYTPNTSDTLPLGCIYFWIDTHELDPVNEFQRAEQYKRDHLMTLLPNQVIQEPKHVPVTPLDIPTTSGSSIEFSQPTSSPKRIDHDILPTKTLPIISPKSSTLPSSPVITTETKPVIKQEGFTKSTRIDISPSLSLTVLPVSLIKKEQDQLQSSSPIKKIAPKIDDMKKRQQVTWTTDTKNVDDDTSGINKKNIVLAKRRVVDIPASKSIASQKLQAAVKELTKRRLVKMKKVIVHTNKQNVLERHPSSKAVILPSVSAIVKKTEYPKQPVTAASGSPSPTKNLQSPRSPSRVQTELKTSTIKPIPDVKRSASPSGVQTGLKTSTIKPIPDKKSSVSPSGVQTGLKTSTIKPIPDVKRSASPSGVQTGLKTSTVKPIPDKKSSASPSGVQTGLKTSTIKPIPDKKSSASPSGVQTGLKTSTVKPIPNKKSSVSPSRVQSGPKTSTVKPIPDKKSQVVDMKNKRSPSPTRKEKVSIFSEKTKSDISQPNKNLIKESHVIMGGIKKSSSSKENMTGLSPGNKPELLQQKQQSSQPLTSVVSSQITKKSSIYPKSTKTQSFKPKSKKAD